MFLSTVVYFVEHIAAGPPVTNNKSKAKQISRCTYCLILMGKCVKKLSFLKFVTWKYYQVINEIFCFDILAKINK